MVPLYTAAIFTAAFLLFLVQPLAARLVLPQLGGSPAVWTATMMFFQVVLLGGYAYAHAIERLARARQAIVHAIVVLSCLVFLPLALPAWWSPDVAPPTPALLLVLLGAVGVPFFAVSSASPLIQAWFARTGHARAHDPYFLYAASNAGSLLGLLAYPLVIEPLLGLKDQGWFWSIGYGLFALLLAGCWAMGRPARTAPRNAKPAAAAGKSDRASKRAAGKPKSPDAVAATVGASPAAVPPESPPTRADLWRQRAAWIALAAAPSSLSLGVTQFITTDIAAIPLLWVIPLAIYLITFIVAFGRFGPAGERFGSLLLPLVVIAVTAVMLRQVGQPLIVVALLHLVLLLVAGLSCHGRLAAIRPGAARLTEYYMLVSLGGALGGASNALAAPLLFDAILEYPIAIAGVCALLALRGTRKKPTRDAKAPDTTEPAKPQRNPSLLRPLLPLIGAAVGVALFLLGTDAFIALSGYRSGDRLLGFIPWDPFIIAITVGLPCLVAVFLMRWPLVFAAVIVTLTGQATYVPMAATGPRVDILLRDRSFFGVCIVFERQEFLTDADRYVPPLRGIRHGTTIHGEQFVEPNRRHDPLSYYSRPGPVGDTFARLPDAPRTIGVVGLGAGTIAAYGRPGDTIDFFEIDRAVADIALDPTLFTYLSDSPATCNIIIGDGRLRLADQPEHRYDLLVLDAFSSDAIPIHLLTREAFRLYASRLRPGGALLVHISNKHFRLGGPVTLAGRDAGLHVIQRDHASTPRDTVFEGIRSSSWVVLSSSPDWLMTFADAPGWQVVPLPEDGEAWTDDHANVLSVLRPT
ncbi:MAG: fused MFS/spermidine synthase [Phycisphaerales bacterium]